jgi:hypothetical protein
MSPEKFLAANAVAKKNVFPGSKRNFCGDLSPG